VIPDSDSPLGERCKLLDFGIAKLTDIGLAGSATRTGAVMGTPAYMSPEQCSGTGAVDHRADLYSLGCILYLLVTGRPPFVSLGAGELIGAHLYKQPEPPSQHVPSISPEFEALVMRLLEKQPDRRVQTARDLGAYLTQIAQRDGWVPAPTDPDRGLSPHGADGRAPTHLTPSGFTPPPRMYTPVFGASEYTPSPPPLVAAPSLPENAPTTLSAATGQSLVQPGQSVQPTHPVQRRARSGVGIALGFGAVALIAGVGFMASRGSDSGSGSSSPASATAPMPDMPRTAPDVTANTEPDVVPQPAPIAPATPPAIAPEAPAVALSPVAPSPVEPSPAASPTKVVTPAKRRPAKTAQPTVKPTTKTTPTTPTPPAVRLIEDDL
jgi:eukaryotic-like serine/threonine-protein kinase